MRNYAKENRLMMWADSVYINQGDVLERNHQVGLMHSIYRCAECVGIWLGESGDEGDLVMEKMTEWKCEFDRLCEPFGDDWEIAVTSISASNTTLYGAKGSTPYGTWPAFQMLIQRAWWRRAWIVQEATALGPFRTLLVCGNRMVNWATLCATLHISHHVAHVKTQGKVTPPRHGLVGRELFHTNLLNL
ncbi:heterokaryon incompatibility protein-domain-containing protein [Nemania serpens]|nr:heterokaryon incompatibility protein-domain-containing protein [Nemania serpens]